MIKKIKKILCKYQKRFNPHQKDWWKRVLGSIIVLFLIWMFKIIFSEENIPQIFIYITVFFLLLAIFLLGKKLIDFIILLVKVAVIICLGIIGCSYLFQTPVQNKWITFPNIFPLTDNQMLVIITGLYAYFTYRILSQNRSFFHQSRIPILRVTPDVNNLNITIKNLSRDFSAKNLNIKLYAFEKGKNKFRQKIWGFIPDVPNKSITLFKEKILFPSYAVGSDKIIELRPFFWCIKYENPLAI